MKSLTDKQIFILAISISFLLALCITWPVILSPRSLLVGHPGNDNWNHVWGYWWVSEALSNGQWPIDASKLAFPNGGTLYFIDTIQAIFAWPIELMFGATAAFNFIIIIQLSICGLGAWLLAHKISSDAWASFIALFLFEFSPHILGQTFNGISETVCAGWFPLTIWALLRMMERPTIKRSIALGLIGGICILTSWYYGLFAAFASIVIIVWSLVYRFWLYEWKKIIPKIVVAAVISLTIIIGPLMSFRMSLSAENAIVTRDPAFVERSLLNHNITDIVAFFNPTQIPSPNLLELYGEQLMIVIYLSWIALGLSFYALFSQRNKQGFGVWIWLFVIFFVFSLGPYLHVGGEYLLIGGKRVPLPFLPLYKLFPIFDRISHPFRFVVGLHVALSVLATVGFRLLFRSRGLLLKQGALVGILFLIIAEVHWFSPAQFPIPHSDSRIPEGYSTMLEDSVEGAVLDLPISVPNLERAVYVWNQSVHNREIPWGLNEPLPQALRQNLLTQTLLQIEATQAISLAPVLPELDLVISSRVLARQGYRYIVVHQKFYPDFKLQQVQKLLNALFGAPQKSDSLLIYTIEPISLSTEE